MADYRIVSLWEQAVQGEGWPRSQLALGMASEPRAGQEPLFSATQRRTREHEIHFEHCSPCRAASKGCFGLATVRSCILMFKMSGNNLFFFPFFFPSFIGFLCSIDVTWRIQPKNLILAVTGVYRVCKGKQRWRLQRSTFLLIYRPLEISASFVRNEKATLFYKFTLYITHFLRFLFFKPFSLTGNQKRTSKTFQQNQHLLDPTAIQNVWSAVLILSAEGHPSHQAYRLTHLLCQQMVQPLGDVLIRQKTKGKFTSI